MGERPGFYGEGDPLMEVAFGAFVRWASSDEETIAAFEKETGMRFARSHLDTAIDEATGHDTAVLSAFVRWLIENRWGGAE